MKNKIFLVVCILFGVFMVVVGLDKFFEFMPKPENMPIKAAAFMKVLDQSKWFLPLVGIAEVVGGALIIAPQYRALGAVIITPVMVGIVLTNYHTFPENMPIAGILAAILIWIIAENRKKYMPMIKK